MHPTDQTTPRQPADRPPPRATPWPPGRRMTVTAIHQEIRVIEDASPATPWDGGGESPVLYVPLAEGDGRPRPTRALPARPVPAQRRRAIPRRYLRPHLFRYTRAEALYDMHAPAGTLVPGGASGLWRGWASLVRCGRRLVTRAVSGHRLKRWRRLLGTCGPEGQLWEVTPPRGFPHLTAVRRWAAETLAAAGYDPGPMLVEWEIFWRRRGTA